MMAKPELDATDARIVNELQGGFPVSRTPFADAAASLGIEEQDLIARISRMCDTGALSRFGPLINAERLGGAVTLAALAVPEGRFDEVAETVNGFREVAHNYAREHRLNMWFVVAADRRQRIGEVLGEIEAATGLAVHDFPKLEEFYIGLKVTV